MSDFQEQQIQTVQNFLNGVVVIDDKIKFTDTSVKALSTPQDDDLEDTAPDLNDPAKGAQSEIQAKEIIESFSNLGIHCVTYPWDTKDTELPSIALNTDIAIFDWTLGGNTAEPLIKELMEKSKDCFRYIVVYTSETPGDIVLRIKDISIDSCEIMLPQKGNIIDYKYKNESHVCYRVEIIKKGDDSELCKKIVEGFSEFSSGFLRNAMLNGITSIRKNAFKLLALYPKKLDNAAISHFTALQSSPDMFDQASLAFHDYISGLISDNISDILLYSKSLKNSLTKKTIISALEDNGSIWALGDKKEIENIDYKTLIGAKTHSKFRGLVIDRLIDPDKEKLEKLKTKIKAGFNNSKEAIRIENNIDALKEFSHNDCCRSRARFSSSEKSNHPLKFGTVIFREDVYYLCLQPLCDSIRLKSTKETIFPFVQLEFRKNNKSFKYVIKKDGDFIGLRAVNKPHQSLHSFGFMANKETGDVRTDGNNIFKGCSEQEFMWVAELKESYVQGLAHSIATQGTRIGMEQFEWLRHKSK